MHDLAFFDGYSGGLCKSGLVLAESLCSRFVSRLCACFGGCA
jgi:hypothetical protein